VLGGKRILSKKSAKTMLEAVYKNLK